MTRALRACALAVVATLALVGGAVTPARAGGSQAVVVVDTGSGTYTRVISFDGTISGYDALVLAGAGPATYGFAGQGVAICQLFGVGNPADDSCLGTGDDPRYWAYYRAPAGSGGWQYSRGGAGSTSVSDGDVEGWRFGAGGAPGYRAFCDVVGCGPPPAPDPAPAPTPGPAPGESAGGESAGGAAASGGVPAPGSTGGASADATGSGGTPSETDGATAGTTLPGGPERRGAGAQPERSRAAGTRALGARPVVADDEGAGSPVGVLVALGLVVSLAGAAVVLRRRGRPSG